MKSIYFILSVIISCIGVAQSNVLSAGYDIKDVDGSASISVGQVDYIYFSGQGGFVSEGVQQPYEWLSTYSGGPVLADPMVTIYPNPTLNVVNLMVEEISSFTIRIYSSTGQLVYSSIHKEEQSVTVDFSRYPVGPYMLEFRDSHKQSPSSLFRIIRL